jgi:hypothetical protein
LPGSCHDADGEAGLVDTTDILKGYPPCLHFGQLTNLLLILRLII